MDKLILEIERVGGDDDALTVAGGPGVGRGQVGHRLPSSGSRFNEQVLAIA